MSSALTPGLLEQLLVVIEGDLADLERHADDLAVDLERVDRGRGRASVSHGGDVRGDVLEESRLVLRLHDAAAPAVEKLGPGVLGLQHRRQLCLESLVFQILELDVHALVRGVVVRRDLVPERLLARVFADVKNGDGRVGEGRRCQRGQAGGRDGEMTKIHGSPPT